MVSVKTATALGVGLFATLGVLYSTQAFSEHQNILSSTTTVASRATQPTMLSIAAAGDIMLGSTFPNDTRMPPNDGADALAAATPIFQAADMAFANLEGPMIDEGVSTKCPPTSTKCFAFQMPTRYGIYLKNAGLDVMSLANNHAGDFGDIGRTTTRQILDGLGIKHAGSDRGQFSTTYLDVKGKKVAVIAFAHNNIVPNVNDLGFARQLVLEADKYADLVMVSFHGGVEGASAQHVPQGTEVFYGEARGNLREFARTVVDAGADLVIGHGPHVLRGMEIYKNRLVAYSMGNFATYGWFKLEGPTAETAILTVDLDNEGQFVRGKITPFVLKDRGVLTADESGSAIRTLQMLSQQDFSSTAPQILADGVVLPK